MKKAILGKKIGMTQVFKDDGTLVPATVINAGPCIVVQKKTIENDGYEAIQVGFGDIKIKKVSKPIKGHFDKINLEAKKFLKEFKLEDISSYKLGSEIKVNIFSAGDRVDISGVSKGKGYQGAIKRHGQSRGPMAHGSKYHRGVGSMGAATSPGRVMKGKKMPGHMGNAKVTIQNLKIIKVDMERNIILVKGSIPGPKGSIVFIKNSVKI